MANEIGDIYKELEIVIDDTNNKELECRVYLKYARDLLVEQDRVKSALQETTQEEDLP